MKNLLILLIVSAALFITSCSDDIGTNSSERDVLDIKQELYDDGDLFESNLLSDYSNIVVGDISTFEGISLQVFAAVQENFSDAKIISIQEFLEDDEHYSVLLTSEEELVIFNTGHVLANATEEKVISVDEIIAGELPLNVLLRLFDAHKGKVIEEVTVLSSNLFEIDFKNGQSVEIDAKGTQKSHSSDDDGDDDGTTINSADLPAAILDYLAQNYPNENIIEAEVYVNGYEVELANGLKLEFDLNGNFIEVSGNNGGQNDDNTGEGDDEDIDPAALPQAILDYIAQNYPNETIVKAEVDPVEYEVTLSNGLKLEFDLEGNFKEISGHSDDDDEENEDNDDDEQIDPQTLPQVVLDYVANEYPSETIVRAELDMNGYDVILSNGLKLEFDTDGNFIEVSGGVGDDDDDDDGDEDGEDDQDINPNDLPQAALDFISNVCPNESIVQAEFYLMQEIYEVTLSNGLEFEFDKDGNFIDISGSDCDEISNSSLPQNIADYINNEFDSSIDKVKQCDYGYRVDLNDDTRIYFKSNGDVIFVGIDD